MFEPGTYPRLDWRDLSDTVQVGSTDGRVVAVLYAVDAGDSWEICGFLTDTPDQEIEVLFGVAEGASAWDTRWQRGQNGCEFLYAESSRATNGYCLEARAVAAPRREQS